MTRVLNTVFAALLASASIGALAKAKPGQLSYGSGGGSGSSDHLAGELFRLMAGVDILHVPYKSGPGALNDLMSGQLSFYLGGIPINLPMIKAGKVKALATSGLKRSPQLPNVPTISEAGLPGFEVNVWYGLFAPRGTPAKIVDKIALDVNQLLKTPEMRERFTALGAEAEGTSPAEFKAYFRNDMDKWRKVVKAAGGQWGLKGFSRHAQLANGKSGPSAEDRKTFCWTWQVSYVLAAARRLQFEIR
jgi:tripartite-type tricarboxylate transporter receptor subunit TctC